MSEEITGLPLPFAVNVMIDARTKDVRISVDPALVFARPLTVKPGEVIPPEELANQQAGVSVNIQKGSAVSVIALLMDDKADQLVEALVTCIIRSAGDKQARAEALLERYQRGIEEGFKTPALPPGAYTGCISVGDDEVKDRERRRLAFKAIEVEGGDNAQTESIEGRAKDEVPGGEEDDASE